MKKIILILFIASLIFLAGCSSSQIQNNQGTTGNQPDSGAYTETQGNIIEITSNGFSPNPLTIKQGDAVTWINKNTVEHWPASAIHPTHNVYPEPGGCIGSKFDACRGLKQDESFSFTFNEKGEWNYHDHLDVSKFGKIIVE